MASVDVVGLVICKEKINFLAVDENSLKREIIPLLLWLRSENLQRFLTFQMDRGLRKGLSE